MNVELDPATLLLVRDLLKTWIDDTEGENDPPFWAMRDWHRIASVVGYP